MNRIKRLFSALGRTKLPCLIAIALICLVSLVAHSQKQVSDVNYDVIRDNYSHKGFLEHNEIEYFIEQGVQGTRVSLIGDSSYEFLYEIKHRPNDSELLNTYYGQNKYNSRLFSVGSELIELYKDYIFIVDILSQELVESIDLREFSLKLESEFSFGDEYFFFKAENSTWSSYVRIGRDSGELDTLGGDGVRVGSYFYYVSSDGNDLKSLDLESNSDNTHDFNFEGSIELKSIFYNDESVLYIKDDLSHYIVLPDHSLFKISCDIPEGAQISYAFEEHIVYSTIAVNRHNLYVVNSQTCNVEFTEAFNNSINAELEFYTSMYLTDEYFFFGFKDDFEDAGEFYIYDIEEHSYWKLDLIVGDLFIDQSIRLEEKYYFLSIYDDPQFYGWIDLYCLNLENQSLDRFNPQNDYETNNCVLGRPKDDKSFTFYATTDSMATISRGFKQGGINNINSFDYSENHGIHRLIYNDLWIDNQYFYTTSDAVFVLKNDITYKVIDLDRGSEITSAFKRYDNYVYLLVEKNGEFNSLKININDYSYDLRQIEDLEGLHYYTETSDNAILNIGPRYLERSSPGFYDVKNEEYISIESLGFRIVWSVVSSKDFIIFQYYHDYGWYLLNTRTREVVLTEIEPGTYPTIFPDEKGGFYLNPWRFADDDSFMYLDSTGSLMHIFDDSQYEVFIENDRFDGNVKSYALRGNDEIIINSISNSEFKRTVLPDDTSDWVRMLFWYESDNRSIIEVTNGDNHETYMFSFTTEPVLITSQPLGFRLIAVMESAEFAVLIYQKGEGPLEFYRLDYQSNNITLINELPSLENQLSYDEPKKLSDAKFLLSINDRIHGEEPWVYDINNNELSLLKDIRAGFMSSELNDFVKNPSSGDFYFTAITTNRDRQLFKLESNLVDIEKARTEDELVLFPNPTNSNIILKGDYDLIEVYDNRGSLLLQYTDYESLTPLELSDLADGVYYLTTQNEFGVSQSVKFVVSSK